MEFNFQEGELLLLDKPYKWTSFDVVAKLRVILKYKLGIKKIKVGHAGTLDPLATGLLIICTGKFTKKIDEYQALIKEYTGTITLGATTPSFDMETQISNTCDYSHLTENEIIETSKLFIGETLQFPPQFSAIQVDGKRAYEYARGGKTVDIKAKPINILEFEIKKIHLPNIDFRILCSKGTYIRSVANDFGEKLKCGAYLSSLCRTKIGNYLLEDAITLDDFEKIIQEQIGQ